MTESHSQVVAEPGSTKRVDEPVRYDDEEVIWQGSPSQLVNLGTYIFWGIITFAAAFGLLLWNSGIGRSYGDALDQVIEYAIAGTLAFAILSCLMAYLSTRYERTVITRNKIKEAKGITSIFRRELFCEISDITDFKSPPAGLLGIFGLSTLVIETHDDDQPIISIRAIPDRDALIKLLLPVWRKAKMDRKGYFAE